MKTKSNSFLLVFITMGAVSLFTACEKGNETMPEEAGFFSVSKDGYTTLSASALKNYYVSEPATLSQEETQGLKLMREEEKLAGDLYEKLYETHALKIFSNIASSEQTHFEAIGTLLDYFEIDDPATSEMGVFNNTELQGLYDSLVVKGSESLTAGLGVGAVVEEIDILDLEELISSTENEDIILVYENLLRGSRNHLRAFNRQLERNGIDYMPAYLNEETFEAIVTSDMERGGYGGCYGEGSRHMYGKGKGTGNGYGNGDGNHSGNGNGKRNGDGDGNGNRNGNGNGGGR